MTTTEAQQFIETIATEKRRQDSADLRNALRLLAEELNSKDSHFILELIQNAEDNRYTLPNPELHITILEGNPCGTPGVQATLVAHNNEQGFLPENVQSLASVGQSTKKKGIASGYIGEKGIGFKSVFRVTDEPHIFSGPFRFRFMKPTLDEPTGYILPHWVPVLPDGLSPDFTTIFLPLLPGKVDGIAAQLAAVAPETLLFLKRIRTLRLGAERQISIEGTAPRLRLSGPNGTREYFVHSAAYPVPDQARDERRQGVTVREISIAFPIDNQQPPAATVFAFLPTEIRSGLPFLVNADFVVSSNREGILQDRPWNVWMRDQIGNAFTTAFLALLDVADLRSSAWRHFPEFDKVHQRHPFFEPTVGSAYEELAGTSCILTDHETLAEPCAVQAPSAPMRKVLTHSAGLSPRTQLLHASWAQAPGILLARLGVRELAVSTFLEALRDPHWLAQQSTEWWVIFLNCCRAHNLTQEALGEFPALKCQDGRCRSTMSTVYLLQDATSPPDNLQPGWPAIHFLDPALQECIRAQPELLAWFSRAFALPTFSVGEYITHSLDPWIRTEATAGRIHEAVSATVFIADQCSKDVTLLRRIPEKLCWIPSDLSIATASASEETQTVTPVGFEDGLAWFQVLRSPTDRVHLTILHQGYRDFTSAMDRKALWDLMQKKGITDCPRPASSIAGGYLAPQWLEQLSNANSPQDLSPNCAVLEQWLDRLYKAGPDKSLATCRYNPSELLSKLRKQPWLPTTEGRSAPFRTFTDCVEIRDFVGTAVPYSKSILARKLQVHLGVQGSLSSETLIQLLRNFHSNPPVPERLILNIYKRLNTQLFDVHRFHEEPLIWLASPSPKWMRAGEATWKAYGTEMDGLTWSVERTYGDHELHGFFVKTIGVTERPTSQQLLTIWATLSQEVPRSKTETQKRMGYLLRDLDALDFVHEPWWPERQGTLRIWTGKGTFAEAADVYVPDSGHAEEMFRDMADIAWVPKTGSKAILPLLIEIGCESLAQSLRTRLHQRPDTIALSEDPKFLTTATKELILLSTLENPVGSREAPLLKALLASRECNHPSLEVRYELENSPWWRDDSAAAHWDTGPALLFVDPGMEQEAQRTDAAKSIARALYPRDTAQHDRIFTLLSNTPKHAAKVAKDRMWAGSPEHFALLDELGLESFLDAAPTDEAGGTAEARPQRHPFPDATPKSDSANQKSESASPGDSETPLATAKPQSSAHGEGEPPPNKSGSSGLDPQDNSGDEKQTRESNPGNRPPPDSVPEAESDDEPEVSKTVKYPHDQQAQMRDEAPEGNNQDAANNSQRRQGNQEVSDDTPRRRRQQRQQNQNRDIEKAAMDHVRKWLSANLPGCEVFDVSHQRAYGHDYIVKWGGKGLRIEVKGHSGDETTIVLTPNELEEAGQKVSAYPWELWNVTNLASRKPVTITRYSSVPKEAIIRETGMRVDLSRCVPARGRLS